MALVLKKKDRPKKPYKKYGWNKKNYELIENCVKAGLLREQIAQVLGVSKEAISKWRREDPKVAEILTTAGQEPNLRVENSLFRRALGYNVIEVTEIVKTNGGGDIVSKKPVLRKHKHVPASVKAIEMWLYNRDPDRWKKQAFLNVRNMSLKDKTELALNGDDD